MKIKDDCFNREAKQKVKVELIDLINQPSDTLERPCPGCRFIQPENRSSTSAEYCSYRCPAAPEQMSSSPEKYSIEAGVVPIVYAFYTMRLMMPCWSCEGHYDGKGNIIKHPKVWFYSTSDFYPKMVAQYVNNLEARHVIENGWMVRILPFSQSMFTLTYSLEPFGENKDLKSLQNDFVIIAKGLRGEILNISKSYVEKIENSPFSTKH